MRDHQFSGRTSDIGDTLQTTELCFHTIQELLRTLPLRDIDWLRQNLGSLLQVPANPGIAVTLWS